MKITYSADQPILNWLYAGPFILDVSERYTDNYIVPYEAYDDLWQEGVTLLESIKTVKENTSCTLFGEEKAWRLVSVHEADTRLTWAKFGMTASLLATLVHTSLYIESAGIYNLKLQGTGGFRLMVNGECVEESRNVGRVDYERTVRVTLKEGWNDFAALLFNVHLHCQNVFRLSVNTPCVAKTELVDIPEELRTQVEKSFWNFYLSDTLLCKDTRIRLCWDKLPAEGEFQYRLTAPDGELIEAGTLPVAEGFLAMPTHEMLPENGRYTLQLTYVLDESYVEGIPQHFERFSFLPEISAKDCDTIQHRKEYILDEYAVHKGINKSVQYNVFVECAKLASGHDELFSPEDLEKTIDYINLRYDCADFALHGLLRFYILYRNRPCVSEDLRQKMKDCILNFKYWVDEPGRSLMFTRSENHEMLFFTAEYIAGSLFPTEIFPNSGQNGLFHALKGRMLTEHWIREKGYHGFVEWHSNTYYEEDLLGMLSVWDFGEENGLLRQLARQLIDLISLFIASNSNYGIMATTHGRCYEQSLMHPVTESMQHLNWLLFGEPKNLSETFSFGAVVLAISNYLPPTVAVEMQKAEELETHTRMGLFRAERQQGVCCSTYRTKHYMVSGMIESKAGEHGSQVNAGEILLEDSVPIFATCFANRSPNTRPSYFGGQHVIPKTIAYRNILAYIYHIDQETGYTHCFFPQPEMDEVVQEGSWLFGRKGKAYVALYSNKPYVITQGGAYHQRELLSMEKDIIWLFELGDEEEYGSFEGFIKAVTSAKLTEEDDGVYYTSPKQGKLYLHYFNTCTVNEKPVYEKNLPMLRNPYAYSEYGSGKIKLCDGSVIDFFA